MGNRVVITGLGVLAGNGKGKEEYWASLKSGTVGYRPISLFNTDEFNVNVAGEVENFDPKVFMGAKGLRNLDRSTTLLVSASKLALADTGFEITEKNTDDVGVSCGTTLGSLKSIAEFDEVTLKEGPRYVNPALFPNTVINSPASQVSIWNNIQGFNTTISTGFTASTDALSYAADFILMDRAKLVYAGGFEELCWHTYFGFHTLKFLSGSTQGQEFFNCPFDKRRNGITFGEGACLIALEDLKHAKKRKANIMAEIKGFGYYFDPYRLNKYNPKGIGIRESIKNALDDAEMGIRDIDYICANANSTVVADKTETEAIKDIFGKLSYNIPVSSVKSMTGECYSVSGALAVAACVGAITKGFVPPTVNLKDADPDCDLNYVPNTSIKKKVNNALIITFGPNGSHSCIIIGKMD